MPCQEGLKRRETAYTIEIVRGRGIQYKARAEREEGTEQCAPVGC
jgi:hypothetical protein